MNQIIVCELALNLIQYDVFSSNYLVFKLIDLVLMISPILVVKLLNQQSQAIVLCILSALRMGVQIPISMDQQYMASFVLLSIMSNKYSNLVVGVKNLSLILAIGLILTRIQMNLSLSGVILMFLLIVYENMPRTEKKSTGQKDLTIDQLPYKDNIDRSQDVHQAASPVYGGLSPIKAQSKISMDGSLLDEYAWIKGQQFIIIDEYENVLLQTFSLNIVQPNSSFSSYENEVESLLSMKILTGNKDFQDLISSNPNLKKQSFTIRDLAQRIMSDYELYKTNYFIITRLDSLLLQNCLVKVFSVCKNRKLYTFIQVELKEPQISQLNIGPLIQYLTSPLNVIMTLSAISESDTQFNETIFDKYFFPIRIASVQMYFYLANLRDFTLHQQKRLMLKISPTNILSQLDDLAFLMNEAARARNTELRIECENNINIDTDSERLKAMLLPLLRAIMRETKDGLITINVQQEGAHYEISITSSSQISDKEVKQYLAMLEKNTFSDLYCSEMLAKYLSGTLQSGVTLMSSEDSTIFKIAIQPFVIAEEMKVIKLIGKNHYYETSLSQLIGQQSESVFKDTLFRESTFKQFMEHSLHFSQSRISKGKQSEYQSNYLSQISKVKADSHPSRAIAGSSKNKEYSIEQISINNIPERSHLVERSNERSNYSSPMNDQYKLPHFPDDPEKVNNNTYLTQQNEKSQNQSRQSSQIDFGSEGTAIIIVPMFSQLKMQNQIIKFSSQGTCCSRILIADPDFQTMRTLEMVLGRLVTRAFTTEETIKAIENKKKCKCGNRGFVIYQESQLKMVVSQFLCFSKNSCCFLRYFISVELPKKGGLWLSRYLKEKMNQDLQKGYIIAITGLTDYHQKVEYHRNGIDHYLSLPYDLQEVSAILQHIS